MDDYNELLNYYVGKKRNVFAQKLFSFVENINQAYKVINGVNEIL